MNKQAGKITFTSMIVFIILVLGGFMAFKFIITGIDKKQIRINVIDNLGMVRGADVTEERVRKIVETVLLKKGTTPVEIYSELDRTKGSVYIFFKYEIRTNYLFFEKAEIVEVEEEVQNYGG